MPIAYKNVLLKIHVFYPLSIVTNVIELDVQMCMLIDFCSFCLPFKSRYVWNDFDDLFF
jgi:hypothetical protein